MDIETAYKLGEDCGKNGANKTNCNFAIFLNPEFTKAWEDGKDKGKIKMKNKCLLCGKKEITNHSPFGNHQPPYVPLCKEHHQDIENIKLAIKVMKREKKISIKRFRQTIDSFNKLVIEKLI